MPLSSMPPCQLGVPPQCDCTVLVLLQDTGASAGASPPPAPPTPPPTTSTPGSQGGNGCHQEEYGTYPMSSGWSPHRYMVSNVGILRSCYVGLCCQQECGLATGWQRNLPVLHSPLPLQSPLLGLLLALAEAAPTSPSASPAASQTVNIVTSGGEQPCGAGCGTLTSLVLSGQCFVLCRPSAVPALPAKPPPGCAGSEELCLVTQPVVLHHQLPLRVTLATQTTGVGMQGPSSIR